MDSEVLTIDEVAKLLCVSPDTIYRLAARGELAGRKVGRIWRIPRSAVEQYLRCTIAAPARSVDVPTTGVMLEGKMGKP